jgi:predicted dehydrogenase
MFCFFLYPRLVMAMEDSQENFTAAIIGAGAVSEYHINGQLRAGSDVVIFEPNAERAAEVSEKFGGLTIAQTLDEAIERADVVHICTPHMVHAEGAKASIGQDKPTVIEKPLTVKLSEAVDIYNAAQREDGPNVPVLVGTVFRLTPPFMTAYDRLHSGVAGELSSLYTSYVHDMSRVKAGNDWRSSPERGSFLYGGGSHAVDLNMWMANQRVTEVQATVSPRKVNPNFPGEEDFNLSLIYEDGTTGRAWVSSAAPQPRHGADVEVYATEATYKAHNKSPILKSFKKGDQDWTSEDIGLRWTMDEMALIFNAFIRGERKDFAPMPDIKEGLEVMIVLDALERAAKSGIREHVPTVEEVVRAHASVGVSVA